MFGQPGGMPPQDPGMGMMPQGMPPPAPQQQQPDPQMMQQVLEQTSQYLGALDQVTNIEEYINVLRGDQLPLTERKAELARLIGSTEEANNTPDKVLALVNVFLPMLELHESRRAQNEAQSEAPQQNGAMAMLQQESGMPQGNFNQGLSDQPLHMAGGGAIPQLKESMPYQEGPGSLEKYYNQTSPLYLKTLIDEEANKKELEADRRSAGSQTLFDIARVAAEWATPGQRNLSPAARLAEVATSQDIFGRLGERAAGLRETRKGHSKERKAVKLAALDFAGKRALKEEEIRYELDKARVNRQQELLDYHRERGDQKEDYERDREDDLDDLGTKRETSLAVARVPGERKEEYR